jgi:8-oxo-dGTP pyrophosphatase MutT (NUDIX family)
VFELNDDLRASITTNLAAHPVRVVDPDERKRAAVAIVVVDSQPGSDRDDPYVVGIDDAMDVPGDTSEFDWRMRDVAGGAAFLLCRRTLGLRRHAGQWALPGGRLDQGENEIEAALRELREELNIDAAQADVLGPLDDYPTRSGYLISPVVVWLADSTRLRPNPGEVEAAFRIPLAELERPDSPQIVPIPESDRPIIRVPINDRQINAPTAAVLYQFRQVALHGLDTRVDGYDQPVFAWR